MLTDKTVVIIGGTSGIGLKTAEAALLEGARVVIAGRTESTLNTAVKQLTGLGEIHGKTVDMRDISALDVFFETIGHVDHLVISGSEVTFLPFDRQSIEKDRENFNSKFWGPYQSVLAAMPWLNHGGSVTFFSGVLSQRPLKDAVSISAINSAIEGLSRALAVNYPNYRFNTIAPGLTKTPLISGLSEQDIAGIVSTSVMQRAASVEEIAEAVLFLMKNTYTTGMTLFVDGGTTLR